MSKVLTANRYEIAAPAGETAQAKPGLFARFLGAMHEARQRAAEREIAKYIECRGGTLTDEIEREISRRYGGIAGQ